MRDPDVAHSVRVDDTAGTHGRGDGGEGGVRGGTGRDAPSPQGGGQGDVAAADGTRGVVLAADASIARSSSSRGDFHADGGNRGNRGEAEASRGARRRGSRAAATGVAAVVAVALAVALGLTTASRTGGVNLQPPAVASAVAAEGIGIGGGTQAYSYSSVRDNNNDDDDDNNHGRRPHKDGLPICRGRPLTPSGRLSSVGRLDTRVVGVLPRSRLSQIYKNHSRRSCEGLAMSMFFTAACANIAYGLAILLRGGGNPTYLINSIPWLLGSPGRARWTRPSWRSPGTTRSARRG